MNFMVKWKRQAINKQILLLINGAHYLVLCLLVPLLSPLLCYMIFVFLYCGHRDREGRKSFQFLCSLHFKLCMKCEFAKVRFSVCVAAERRCQYFSSTLHWWAGSPVSLLVR